MCSSDLPRSTLELTLFPYTTLFRSQVEASVDEMEDHLVHEHLPSLSKTPTALNLANKKVYAEAQQAYFELVSAISHYEEIRTWLAIGNSVAILYGDKDTIQFINEKRKLMVEVEKDITARINEIREFYRKITAVITSSEWQKYSFSYPWYVINSGEVMYLREKFQNTAKSNLFVEERLPSTVITRRQSERPIEKRMERRAGVLPQQRRVVIANRDNGIHPRLQIR